MKLVLFGLMALAAVAALVVIFFVIWVAAIEDGDEPNDLTGSRRAWLPSQRKPKATNENEH